MRVYIKLFSYLVVWQIVQNLAIIHRPRYFVFPLSRCKFLSRLAFLVNVCLVHKMILRSMEHISSGFDFVLALPVEASKVEDDGLKRT